MRRRHVARALLALALLATAVLVVPGMHASSTQTEVAPFELGDAASPPSAAIVGPVSVDVDGYRVAPGLGVVAVPLDLPRPRQGRTLLRIWAYGPAGVETTATLRAADGSQRTLGRAGSWVGKAFDVSEQARRGPVSLRVSSRNATAGSVLFFDRVAPVAVSGTPDLRAPAWGVGLLVALLTIVLLELTGRVGRHWPLALLLAPTAAVLWNEIADMTFVALKPDSAATWTAATSASWLGLHDGVLSGSWADLSSLAVQVFHAWTPVVGTDPVAARAAAVLTALLALAAVYAFAHRAAGRVAAVVAMLLALASSGFRDAIVDADALPVLVLAGALFGYALHACLNDATPIALAVLGAGAALLALAEPTWLPGALLVILAVALVCTRPPLRHRALVAGLLATLVCLVPHLASTASQNDGRMLAAFTDRTAAVRSPSRIADGLLTGGQRSIDAFHPAATAELAGTTAVADTIARVAVVAGALFVLLLARLRLLVLLSAVVVAPTLFISARTALDPAHAGAALWPAMLVAATILGFTAVRMART